MAASCPICSGPTAREYRPFCSRRCADVDLQRWLVGRYAIPAARDEDGDDDETPIPAREAEGDR
jgi:hypothetical protein